MIPAGLLLGVFVMTFSWLALRMNQTNPAPGSSARIVATVDADYRDPIVLAIQPPLRLDESSDPKRFLPPIRETLERLSFRNTLSESAQSDLRRYLRQGVPAQKVVWIVRCDEPGSFPVTLMPGKSPATHGSVVFGEDRPPPGIQKSRRQDEPIRAVCIENPAPKSPFWALKSAALSLNRGFGWLAVYLVAYYLNWLLLSWLLRRARR